MITAHDMHWHPDAVRHDGNDPDYCAANQHRMMDGKIYAPADNLKLGYEGTSIDRPHGAGLLFMSFGDVGLSTALPPPQPARACRGADQTGRYGRSERRARCRRRDRQGRR